MLYRTRFGILVRAATQDREMVGALGVNQSLLFTGVFALGAFLAGLGGALQLPREPANLGLDLVAIGEAFVVVVVGGMGSIPGAFLAALLIAELKAVCIAIGQVKHRRDRLLLLQAHAGGRVSGDGGGPDLAAVGLLGGRRRSAATPPRSSRRCGRCRGWLRIAGAGPVGARCCCRCSANAIRTWWSLMIDILVAVLFATSLHFIMGPGGMHSFGHAAYFGLGAYGAALLFKTLGLPMIVALLAAPLVAAIGALLFGWFAVRLSGVVPGDADPRVLADRLVGGVPVGRVHRRIEWPGRYLAGRPGCRDKRAYYYLTLAAAVAGVWLLRRVLFSPFGYAMRAGRDSRCAPMRSASTSCASTGRRSCWRAWCAGVAGALFAFSKGSISPEVHGDRPLDRRPGHGAAGRASRRWPARSSAPPSFTWLQDTVARETEYWRAMLGGVILLLVMLFPVGIAGRDPASDR